MLPASMFTLLGLLAFLVPALTNECTTGDGQCHTDYSSMLQTPIQVSSQSQLTGLSLTPAEHKDSSKGHKGLSMLQLPMQALSKSKLTGLSLTQAEHKDSSKERKGVGLGLTESMQTESKKHEVDHFSAVTTTASPEDAANEPEKARPAWVNMLIFFSMATAIFLVMLLFVSILQLIVRWQRRLHEQVVADWKNKDGPVRTKSMIREEEEDLAQGFDDDEIALYLGGSHTRLDLLLSIASASYPRAAADELVLKGSKANKLGLSDYSRSQASSALQALAKAAHALHKKRDSTLTPKEKLKRALSEVRWMVKFARATRRVKAKEQREVLEWTADADHGNRLSDKYADGHRDSAHGGLMDKTLFKFSFSAYFASEAWIDHAAIFFVISYSQVCAVVYAMYLKWRFPMMYKFMGPWLLVSRGEAMAIIVLTVFMVLLMSRRFITMLRNYVHWSSVLETVVDKHVLMHRCIGSMIVVCAVLHIIGHLKGSIPAIINEADVSVINKAFTYGTKLKFNFNTWGEAALCYPAVTGYVLICLLCCFWATSNQYVRRWSFEVFHYLHLILIVLWCTALALHGARQWLGVGVPLGLLAVAPVVIYYVTERISDIWNGLSPEIKIANGIIKKKSVLLEIDIGCSGFKYETGMYCMLKVPAISEFQWHPFTIASAGGERTFQVLFATVGDWTTQLKDLIQESQKKKTPYPEIAVRGGYGAPANAMKEKKHIVLVGAGVGATPFLSFLSNICSAAKAGRPSQFDGLETAVFYWVSREPEDFVWINQYNSVIAATPTLKDRVSVRLCLSKTLETAATDGATSDEIALFWMGVQVALGKFKAKELGSELAAPTQFGRPNWEKELVKCAKEAKETIDTREPIEVSVFACGNAMLVKSLEDACDKLTDDTTAFRLFAEEF